VSDLVWGSFNVEQDLKRRQEAYWKKKDAEIAEEKVARKEAAHWAREEQKMNKESTLFGHESSVNLLDPEGMPEEYYSGGGMSDLYLHPASAYNMVGQLAADAVVSSDPRLAAFSLGVGLLSGARNQVRANRFQNLKKDLGGKSNLEGLEDIISKDKLIESGDLQRRYIKPVIKEGIEWHRKWNKHPETLRRRMAGEKEQTIYLKKESNKIIKELGETQKIIGKHNHIPNLYERPTEWWQAVERNKKLEKKMAANNELVDQNIKNLQILERPENTLHSTAGWDTGKTVKTDAPISFADSQNPDPYYKRYMSVLGAADPSSGEMYFNMPLIADQTKSWDGSINWNEARRVGAHEFGHATFGGKLSYDKNLVETQMFLSDSFKMKNGKLELHEDLSDKSMYRIDSAGLAKPTETTSRIAELRQSMGWKNHDSIPKGFKMTREIKKKLEGYDAWKDLELLYDPEQIGVLMRDLSSADQPKYDIESVVSELESIA
jgi:hypothetical protein